MSKSVLSVSVCIALLAASAAVSSAYAANDKTSAISSTNIAYAALVDGRNKVAIRNYSLAIESRKLPTEKLGRAFLNRALAYQNSGKYNKAIDDYTAAIQLDAMSAKMRAVALYNRGLAHEKINSPAMAIEDFTGALLLDPQFSQSYYSRANVLRKHGQYLLAIADYKKARRFNHAKPHLAYFGEALTYEKLNRKSVAKALLKKALVAKPDFIAARRKLVALGSNAPFPVIASKAKRQPIKIAMITPAVMSDTLITGSISPSQADVTIRKTSLPKAVGVPKSIVRAPTLNAPVISAPMAAVRGLPLSKKAKVAAKGTKIITAPKEAPVTRKQVMVSDDKMKTAPLSGWTVQLSSQRNDQAAWDVWKNLSDKYKRILKGQKATVVKANLGSRGVFYRLRIHQLDSKKKAARLCGQLKRKGMGCFVSKA